MIFSRGFKQYNNTLLNIRIQTGLSSGHLKIVGPITKAQVKMKSKVFRNPSQTTMGFENFREGSVGYLKITEDKAINTD